MYKRRRFITTKNSPLPRDASPMNILKNFIEFLSWLGIITSPTLGGLLIGGIIVLVLENRLGIILGIICTIIGLIIGVLWAKRIRKKMNYSTFISWVMATPELDIKSSKEEKNSNS